VASDPQRLPSTLEQIGLVAGLRWRILRNNLRRKNNRWDLIGLIFAAFGGAALVLAGGALVFALTSTFLGAGQPSRMVWIFWGIFLWWQVFPVFATGFGAAFQFRTLLRFPLSLRAFYLLSLSYGFADFSALASVFWLLLMNVAAAVAQPAYAPAMMLASVLFMLVNVTLERLLGSWLERLLAKRRSREIFFAIFITLMISLQFISPLLERYGASVHALAHRVLPYLAPLPGSLAGRAVAASSPLHFANLAAALGGLALWALACGTFLWMRCAAQHRGEELSESAAPAIVKPVRLTAVARVATTPMKGAHTAEAHRSILPPAVMVVCTKEFHYLVRNGFAVLVLFVPPMLVLLFSVQFAGKNPTALRQGLSAELFFPGMMAYVILVLMTPAFNSFAYESRGIQAYYLSPQPFRTILLGKNAMLVCLIALEMLLSMMVLLWRVGMPSLPMFAATVAAIVFAVAGQLTAANWSSLSFPRKLEFGQMRGQRNSGAAVWIAFGAQFLLAGICSIVFLIGKLLDQPWLPALAFVLLSAGAVAGYAASLHPLSALAERNKELMIETLCR
jgi:ABC-2 type transport system permease protein